MKYLPLLLVLAACAPQPTVTAYAGGTPTQRANDLAACRDTAQQTYYGHPEHSHAAENTLGILTLFSGGQFIGQAIDDAVAGSPGAVDRMTATCMALRGYGVVR